MSEEEKQTKAFSIGISALLAKVTFVKNSSYFFDVKF
jgi:hypothetical protein